MILRHLALGFKIPVAIIWFGAALVAVSFAIGEMHMSSPPRDAPHDWGTAAYFHRTYLRILALSALALFSVAPNRWFVFSPIVFCIAILIALFPLVFSLVQTFSEPFNTASVVFAPSNLIFMLIVFGPLPLSLTFSFCRRRRGEKVGYA
jgi:hypothetical protein